MRELLIAIFQRIDHSRVVAKFDKRDLLPLIKPYLLDAQQVNNPLVNQAYHKLLLDEGDYEGLRKSIDMYPNFDGVALGLSIKNSQLLEFRRIAAHLFKVESIVEMSLIRLEKQALAR